jgi:Uma2 family endonuclease
MDDGRVVLTRHRLDADEYYRMAEAGILGEDDRIELIDGELIDMAPIGQDHASSVNSLNEALVLAFTGRAIISPQNPVRLDRFNEPQPDFAVFRSRADNYRTGERPGPADVLLLIEVADSSLRFDRTIKLPLYARAGIAEVWIIDLMRRVLNAYRRPAGDGYDEMTTHQPGDSVGLALAPDIRIPLDRVFG